MQEGKLPCFPQKKEQRDFAPCRPQLVYLYDRDATDTWIENMKKNLSRNSGAILYILFSAAFLWFPAKFNLLLLGISLCFILMNLIKKGTNEKGVRAFQYILLLYGLFIIISSVSHFYTLSTLEPTAYIPGRNG